MKILLATDGSAFSEDAARFLTRLNYSPQDEIIVLHVITSVPYDDDYQAQIKRFIRRVSPEIRRTAVDILGHVRAKIISQEEEGAPDEAIMRVATEAGVDLIVMGARGIRGLKSLFIGSVTRSVAAVSSIPLLVTKSHQAFTGDMRVLFATDGSPTAEATGHVLSMIPFPRDAELIVMNVAPSGIADIPERYAIEMRELMQEHVELIKERSFEEADRILAAAEVALRGKFSAIRRVVKSGDPAIEILGIAETGGIDLIAVGSRGIRGIKGMLGSVSRRVLGLSPCPVLIGKKSRTS